MRSTIRWLRSWDIPSCWPPTLLWRPDQVNMARKIGQQARRTRELVSSLLSFAQQSPGEKTLLDMGSLLQRALQMKMLRIDNKNIRLESRIATDLPHILGKY